VHFLRHGVHRLTGWIAAQLDALFSLGTLEPISDAAMEGDEALLGEVEHALASTDYGSKFSILIEQRFKQSTAGPRGRLFLRLALAGLLIYNLFLFVDAAIVSDVMWLAVPLQLCVVTPIILGLMIVYTRHGIDPELPSFLCISIMVAGTIALFMVSRSPHVNLFACLFGLFLISGNVALALSFATSLAFTVLCVAGVSTAILLHPLLDAGDRTFSIAMLVATANYSLGGSYRIESSLRSAYLFALRESLRARLLAASNRELQSLVAIDGLTGIGNRRHLDETLALLWQSTARNRSIAFLIIDVDHFKRFNDDHGHQKGDECLRRVAQALADAVTIPTATVARYGGEEFAVVVPGLAISRATALAERLRRTIEGLEIELEGGERLAVTISIGCSVATPSTWIEPADLIEHADAALYDAKRAGRNRVGIAGNVVHKVPALPAPRPLTIEAAVD
jgi:diguanylate cyclase (GGDEF)-like protein